MNTIRQHLAAVHQSEAQQCSKLADECAGLAKVFGEMGKAADADEAPVYKKAAAHFNAMAKIHGDAAEAYSGFQSECAKADEDNLNKIIPDRVRGTIPSDVP